MIRGITMGTLVTQNNYTVLPATSLERALADARSLIDREYLNHLCDAGVSVLTPVGADTSSIRILQITRIVYSEGELTSRLSTVYQTLSGIAGSLFLLVDGEADHVSLYLGVRSVQPVAAAEALLGSLKGNLPGIETASLSNDEITRLISRVLSDARPNIAAVSQIPSRRAFEAGETQNQCLEQFLDSMSGKTYTALLLAVPLSEQEIRNRKGSLENLYTSITPAARRTLQYTVSQNDTIQTSIANGITNSVTDSISSGTTVTAGDTQGQNQGSIHNVHLAISSVGLGSGGTNGTFQSTTNQKGTTNGTQKGTQHGTTQTLTNGITTGTNQSLAQSVTLENKPVIDLLKRIDAHIERIERSEAYGLFECCGFFLSERPGDAFVAASSYKALLSGENSSKEAISINMWDSGTPAAPAIIRSLAQFSLPRFQLRSGMKCTPGSLMDGAELPLVLGLPQHSVNGVVVVPMAGFGRSIHYYQKPASSLRMLDIGRVYHMGTVVETPVCLAVDALTAHALFAGTTGTGKTTLITKILSAIGQLHVKFMVIEPVKGEYKHLLGALPGIRIYTPNPLHHRMLRINPFVFEHGSVLQHIDSLVSILQVCWPLYAAQPALLRDCIQRAYSSVGWDTANNMYLLDGAPQYPTFETMLEIIPQVIQESHFVGESRGTYEGALLTRIRMLATGTFGQVFGSTVSLTDKELFEENVIIDLSEYASQEVNALIMGILMIRQREYLTHTVTPGNLPLRHITVLEEAHNLLQREQHSNVEGGQTVSGQTVQMLANSIAELRTYGESIFLSDQSPHLLHPAAIRNTATKIVFRLPETADRADIQGSLSLTDEQANEFSRLPDITALVTQRNWLEPVLTRISPDRHTYHLQQPLPMETTTRVVRLRGGLVSSLLQDCSEGAYHIHSLLRIVNSTNLLEDTRANYRAVLQTFGRRYEDLSATFHSSARQQAEFYSQLFQELLHCEDLFRLCPLPQCGPEYSAPYEKDHRFQTACRAWQDTITRLLPHYASGCTDEDYRQLLEYLLMVHVTPEQITVHNALYGAFHAKHHK